MDAAAHRSSFAKALRRFRASPAELVTTSIVFLAIGVLMNSFGKWAHLAEFKHWWQVATCYLGYVVPLALFIRGMSLPMQYAVCVAAFLPLEVVGYALGTSIAHEGNAFEAVFGVRNFTAVMVAGVSFIPPIGLLLTDRVLRLAAPRGAPAP